MRDDEIRKEVRANGTDRDGAKTCSWNKSWQTANEKRMRSDMYIEVTCMHIIRVERIQTHAQTYVHDPTCIVCTYLCMLGGRHIQTYICMHECMRVCLQICSCIPRHMRWWSKLAIRVIRHAVHAYISIFGFCSYRAIRENLLPLHALSKVSRTTMKLPQP